MVRRKDTQSGSSTIKAVAAVAAFGAVAAIGAAIWIVHPAAHAAIGQNAATIPTQTASQPSSNVSSQPAFAAWPVLANTTYGFSFNLPTDWTTSGDSTYDPTISATRQEFGTSLMPNAGSSAVNVEVLDEPLQTAEAWYDQYYAQTPIKVNKTTGNLKGKQSVEYDFVAPTYETKQYLFAVGAKTYLFSSVNESLNTSVSPSYWSNFDNIFNSLAIQK